MSSRIRLLAQRFAGSLLLVAASAVAWVEPALAMRDPRSQQAASQSLDPVIPEPTSILLFAAGVAVVGYGAHRIRARRR